MTTLPPLQVLTAKDFTSDQEVRWCPGCGDFSILAQLKSLLVSLGVPREKFVFVSGIGCAGRLPYYLDTYGFHTVAGRALTVATGIKLANPELSVWVITGDGDGLASGGNHFIHALRRNVDVKVLLFNNEVYGLTKGQFSPTSRVGTLTRSSPHGSVDQPLRPVSLALSAEAGFVARTIDVDVQHLSITLRRAAEYRGTAFVEIYQNCPIFNPGVFEYATELSVKHDNLLYLRHGQPLVFGADSSYGIVLNGLEPEKVRLTSKKDRPLLVHDERATEPTLAFLLSRFAYPSFPECMGVFRCLERPTYVDQLTEARAAAQRAGVPSLERLLEGDEPWDVPPPAVASRPD